MRKGRDIDSLPIIDKFATPQGPSFAQIKLVLRLKTFRFTRCARNAYQRKCSDFGLEALVPYYGRLRAVRRIARGGSMERLMKRTQEGKGASVSKEAKGR